MGATSKEQSIAVLCVGLKFDKLLKKFLECYKTRNKLHYTPEKGPMFLIPQISYRIDVRDKQKNNTLLCYV